ncbi:MAG: VTT domain-containing protein [Myxococcota bacterium]
MKRRVLVVGLLCAFIGAALLFRRTFGAQLEPQALVQTLRALGEEGWAVPAFVVLYGVGTTLLAPALSFVVVAGVTWGFWPGWLIAWLSTNLWANVHFLAGRWIGRDRLKHALARRGVTRVLRELEHGGVLAVVVLRQFPLPFVGVNVAAGASPIAWRRFALGNALGLLPGALVVTQLASSLADGVDGAREAAGLRVAVAAALVVALAVGTRLVVAWWERRSARAA